MKQVNKMKPFKAMLKTIATTLSELQPRKFIVHLKNDLHEYIVTAENENEAIKIAKERRLSEMKPHKVAAYYVRDIEYVLIHGENN